MVRIPIFRLACIAGAVLALGSNVSARPAGGPAAPAGVRAPALASAAPGRVLAGPMRPVRPGLRAHGRHVPGGAYGYGLGGYGPGFYDSSLNVLLGTAAPDYQFERVEPPSIPVAIGIQRPPAADPVIYRIENRGGRQVARVVRIGADGIVPIDTGERRSPARKR